MWKGITNHLRRSQSKTVTFTERVGDNVRFKTYLRHSLSSAKLAPKEKCPNILIKKSKPFPFQREILCKRNTKKNNNIFEIQNNFKPFSKTQRHDCMMYGLPTLSLLMKSYLMKSTSLQVSFFMSRFLQWLMGTNLILPFHLAYMIQRDKLNAVSELLSLT